MDQEYRGSTVGDLLVKRYDSCCVGRDISYPDLRRVPTIDYSITGFVELVYAQLAIELTFLHVKCFL